jgi:hypothetical protein
MCRNQGACVHAFGLYRFQRNVSTGVHPWRVRNPHKRTFAGLHSGNRLSPRLGPRTVKQRTALRLQLLGRSGYAVLVSDLTFETRVRDRPEGQTGVPKCLLPTMFSLK